MVGLGDVNLLLTSWRWRNFIRVCSHMQLHSHEGLKPEDYTANEARALDDAARAHKHMHLSHIC